MKIKLWDRIERGMEEGFDAALSAVHVITEKAGEGIELTRLRREKARLETQVTRQLAELGNAVYDKISVERLDDVAEKLGVKAVMMEISENEARMIDIDRSLNKELKGKKDPGTDEDVDAPEPSETEGLKTD
ncbi:MAG: hypothetical protein K9N21_20070 [Deltaproteobacteria bacterium]|jgi:hypothetical protein|nr:hypothetical protein [Deltaproteobacteria bacterium]